MSARPRPVAVLTVVEEDPSGRLVTSSAESSDIQSAYEAFLAARRRGQWARIQIIRPDGRIEEEETDRWELTDAVI